MKNNNLVEEAIIQMKNVERAIAENAKGILQSTMKEEISQLVKESLYEQDDEEINIDSLEDDNLSDISDEDSEEEIEFDVSDEIDDESDEMEFDDSDEMDDESDEMEFDDSDEMDDGSDEKIVDLTDLEDDDEGNEELLSIFAKMSPEDGIIVKKDKNQIHIKDDKNDSEYLVNLGESEDNVYEYSEMGEEDDDHKTTDSIINALFGKVDSEIEEEMYETIYEIEMDDESGEMEFDDSDEEIDYLGESYNPKKVKKGEHKEGKMSIKPKGLVGRGPKKVNFKSNTEGGFKEEKTEAFKGDVKASGTGRVPKDVFKKGENMEGKPKNVKKVETKEAARTYGFGSKEGRGLRKGVTPNRNLKFESLEEEITLLRQKNEEYRKALNVFREKLNEVAVFNSNLAYATRLFTEHSTTKKEKINILRRFDNVENIKESKTLYKSIKDELTKTESKPINETIENKINKTVTTGSSTTLMESKTYENPQFLRMKDLMGKLG